MAAPVSQPPVAAPRPSVGEELTLRVESLAFGGAGVARAPGGYVVFVEGGFPGDLVRARVHQRKRSYAQARVTALLEPGLDQVAPLADHPGAPWQVLRYDRQLEIKSEQVDDALRRIGKLDGFALEPIVAAQQQWRYRNKLEYSFGTADDGTLECGFHAPGSWERIQPIEDCLLASEAGNQARREVLAFCRAQGLAAFDRRTHEGFLRNLVVREGRRSGQLLVRLVTVAVSWTSTLWPAPSTATACCGPTPTPVPRRPPAGAPNCSPARRRSTSESASSSCGSRRRPSSRPTRRWRRFCTG